MKRLWGCVSLGVVLVFLFGGLNAVWAEDVYKVGSPFNIKMGDSNWEVKVTNYVEKPYTSAEKRGEAYLTYVNQSPDKKVQKIDRDNWSFYIIADNGSSYKADPYHYKRDPGEVNWYSEDVLPGASFPVRIPINLPKEVVAGRLMMVGEVASPSQVVVEIPSSMVTRLAVLPSASTAGPSAQAAAPSSVQAQSSSTGLENEAQAGYGVIIGRTMGLSGVYWAASPLGGQVIVGQGGASDVLSFNARLLLKCFAAPFGRLILGPQVGYEFTAQGSVSKSSYGVILGAEYIMPFPVTVVAGKELIHTKYSWLSFLAIEKARAIGISAEIGMYGKGIRNATLDPEKLTKGFNMAGHIYL